MLKTKENPKKATQYSRSWSLTRVIRLHEVPTTVLRLEKNWCFGQVGAHDRTVVAHEGSQGKFCPSPAPYLVS